MTLIPGEKRTFEVATPRPVSHALDVVWTMDGVRVGTGARYEVESSGSAYGSHELRVEVRDPTPLVRSDPSAALSDSRSWTVTGYFGFATLKIAAAEGGTTDPAPGSHVFAAGAASVVRAIPYANYAFAGWTGDVPAGHELDNPLTVVMNAVRSLRATFRKTLLAPLDASARKILNRSLSQAEYVNVIKFSPNPASTGVAGYRIYRIDGPARVEIASLDPDTFEYAVRGVLKLREYTYAIVAFSASDQESEAAYAFAR